MSQNKAFNAPFLLAVVGIYLSYFLHGVSVITLAQNMTSLAEKFGTDNAGIAYLISGIGLGRLVSILFFGVISDKFGRRSVILLGVSLYILFFFGIPASPNLVVAFGQMLYPMLVSYLLLSHIWYGYAMIIPGVLFVLVSLLLLKSKFPSQLVDATIAKELPQMNSKPLAWL